jgi:hypothetical protein
MTSRQLRKIKNLNTSRYNMGGYKSKYNVGGVKRYQPGGMYAENTVASTGQGNIPLNTSNIVYQENNPALQEQRLKGFTDEKNRLIEATRSSQGEAEAIIEQGEEQGKLQGEFDATQAAANVDATQGLIKTGLKGLGTAATQAGLITPSSGSTLAGALKDAKTAYDVAKTGTTAANVVSGLKTGTDVAKIANTGIKTGQTVQGLNLVKDTATTGLSTAGNAGLLTNTATGASTAGSVGAGIGKFATSGAGLGLIGTGLGYGVDALWGDDDATTSNAGDIGGAMLKGAGTGASFGSFFPGPGTAIGAGVGALWGLGTELFGSHKARKAEKKAIAKQKADHKRKVKKLVTRSNKDLMENFGSNYAAVRAGELKGKTYSGYDLGRNVVAQMGGMRMGTPRYGYTA